jgi:glycosyltransferase involved in cell wall biosynthesis
VKILSHPFNRGKGAAVRTALEQATGDIVLIQDGDLEYDPADYPNLLRPILDHRADVVYGSRFTGGTHRVLLFWHYLANRLLTLLSNMLCNLNLTDMETCYKVFRRQCVEGLNLKSNRFGIEPELTAKLARRHYRFYETGINYSGRDYSEGKKINWKDGLAALWFIPRYRFFD